MGFGLRIGDYIAVAFTRVPRILKLQYIVMLAPHSTKMTPFPVGVWIYSKPHKVGNRIKAKYTLLLRIEAMGFPTFGLLLCSSLISY